tara:strand:+ start:285 stop:518 length:234 start_codon:yes stop_codon:yes gene_type:complete
MSKDNKPQMITINDVEYDTATFSEEQIVMTNHCLDLDRKINNMNFQTQQLQVGKDSFLKMLTESLETVDESFARQLD